MSFDNNLEGYNVVRAMWLRFWNPSKGTFICPMKRCNGTIGDDGKFNVWSVSVAVHAIVDGARIYPNELGPLIEPAIQAMYRYRSPKYHGYCAAENFDGNKDIYYDDDAQVASALICAYEVTGKKEYLDSGRDLVRFLMGGYNKDKKSKARGGMMWHIDKDYCNAVTTAECAIAALRLLKYVPEERKVYYDYANECIKWQLWKLRDKSDNIIWDGVGKNGDKIDKTKWTYNTGTTLSAICMLYTYDHDEKWVEEAKKLAEAATDRGRSLFCRDYDDWSKRYWRDPSYFIQLLIEGLADYLLVFGKVAPPTTAQCIQDEIVRHLSFFKKYMYDPNDGLYYIHFEINKINKQIYERYKNEFGGNKKYEPNGEERSGDGDMEKRPMAKCLIGAGSAARIFFQGARIAPTMNPRDS
ncbi:unnamed protein product [Kuraishia capsulata CBS 1993]|uniref:Glycoside hydrolase family 76 protein n=1 Tax=Kuraishia capsulata CBS 1993 TaxID=1382522 RepID=W6MSF7_9ASCO|nr:uncharacterized protein KUCA_T00000696001 [Kuraishia capsulata CBS 1993]CDK24730.1 unnamed protein product [Kuraishia capsulata CBS 1993]